KTARVSAVAPCQAGRVARLPGRLASSSSMFFSARASLARSFWRKPAKTSSLTSVLTDRRVSAMGGSGGWAGIAAEITAKKPTVKRGFLIGGNVHDRHRARKARPWSRAISLTDAHVIEQDVQEPIA